MHPVSHYVATLNMLLAAERAFNECHVALGTALLVQVEKRIPEIEGALEFLSATTHADRLWRKYLINSTLCPAAVRADNAVSRFDSKVRS